MGKPNSQSNRVGLRYNVLEWFNSVRRPIVVVSSKFPRNPLCVPAKKFIDGQTLGGLMIGFWEKELRFGHTTQLDFAHQFAKRWAYDITVTGKQSAYSHARVGQPSTPAFSFRPAKSHPSPPGVGTHASTRHRPKLSHRRNFRQFLPFVDVLSRPHLAY